MVCVCVCLLLVRFFWIALEAFLQCTLLLCNVHTHNIIMTNGAEESVLISEVSSFQRPKQ